MKKIRPFRLSDETMAKLDGLCGGNRTEWIERVIEAGGNLGGVVLSGPVKERLRGHAEKMDLSEGAVLEMAVMEFGKTPVQQAQRANPGFQVGHHEFVPNPLPAGYVAPKGSFSKDDLKALIAGKGSSLTVAASLSTEPDLADVPEAPFDLDIEGEPHRVSQLGRKGLWLFYVGPDGLKPLRALVPGELEKFWEKRNK